MDIFSTQGGDATAQGVAGGRSEVRGQARGRGRVDLVRAGVREIADLAWPCTCVGCDAWGPPWCATCDDTLVGSPLRVRPALAPHLVVHAAEEFAGPLRHAVSAFKDDGRRDAITALAPLARRAVASSVLEAHAPEVSGGGLGAGVHHDDRDGGDHHGLLVQAARRGVVLVPVPSTRASFRARGRRPLEELAARIRSGTSLVDGRPALRHRGHVRDQSRLGLAERARNVESAFRVPDAVGSWLSGRQPLLVLFDDVVTSGATLGSAHRVLTRAGARFIVCAAVAATPRENTGRSFR